MDNHIVSQEYNSAIEQAVQALKQFDDEREFENSISVLEKMIEIAELQNDQVKAGLYADHLRIRSLLSRNREKFTEIKKKFENSVDTPLKQLLNYDQDPDKSIIVETLEKQSIFGDYEPVHHVPYLNFQHHDDAIKMIEEYFEEGRYIVNLLDKSTSLHQAINLDVGDPEEVNIVDREQIFKLSK